MPDGATLLDLVKPALRTSAGLQDIRAGEPGQIAKPIGVPPVLVLDIIGAAPEEPLPVRLDRGQVALVGPPSRDACETLARQSGPNHEKLEYLPLAAQRNNMPAPSSERSDTSLAARLLCRYKSAMSIDVDKKSKRGRPKVVSELVCSRIAEPVLGHLNAWIAAQPDAPTRPEAVRRLLQEALTAKGTTAAADTHAELSHEIASLERDLASIPAGTDQSPAAGLRTMDRAIAENELVELRHKRKRIRTAKPRPTGGRS